MKIALTLGGTITAGLSIALIVCGHHEPANFINALTGVVLVATGVIR